MTYVQKLVSGCLFFATISCVASEALTDNTVWEAEAKSIVTSNGQIYAALNTTIIMYTLIGIAGVALIGGLLIYLSTTGGLPDGIPLNSKNSQNYYDPATDGTADTGLEYAAADLQNTNTSHEYRRKRSAFEQNMVTKMLQLEQIFKKYEVEEDECRAYIACEAANVERLAENGPIVQKTHELFNAINYAKPEHLAKINASKGMMIMKQAYDSAKARQHEVDVCAPLRDACSALRQKKN